MKPSFACLLLSAVAASCASQDAAQDQDVVWLVRHGQYADALASAQRLAEENPENPRVQALYRDTQVAYLLDLGRNAVFSDEPNEGLDAFYRAYEIDPDNAVVHAWIAKTRHQIAQEWLDRASELRGPDQLEEAERAYETVLTFVPESPEGKRGLSRVLLLKNYRAGLSKTYFTEGVHQFRDYWFHPARWNFDVSYRYDSDNDTAKSRRGQVDGRLVQERLAQARDLEEQGIYTAARNEYRLALLIDPDSLEAQDGIDRMDVETRATRNLAKAEMDIRRGEYEQAAEILEETEELTEEQTDTVGRLEAQIEDEKLLAMYNEAKTLERDFRYAEAVEAYGRLLEVAPFYEDADARRRTIEEFILLAEDYYARALDSESDQIALEYLRQIPIIWPEYRDVAERIAELEARIEGSDDPE